MYGLADFIWVSSYLATLSQGFVDDEHNYPVALPRAIESIARGTQLPMVVDAGSGTFLGKPEHLESTFAYIQNDITFVVDDAVYPRSNSFYGNNELIEPTAVVDRLAARLEDARSVGAQMAFRSEMLNTQPRTSMAIFHAYLAGISRQFRDGLSFVLPHGLNCRSLTASGLSNDPDLPPLATLTTLAEGMSYEELETLACDVVIVPNILGRLRGPAERNALQRFLSGDTDADAGLPPFGEAAPRDYPWGRP